MLNFWIKETKYGNISEIIEESPVALRVNEGVLNKNSCMLVLC